MRISDWSSDVCSSDLGTPWGQRDGRGVRAHAGRAGRGSLRVRGTRVLGAVLLRAGPGPLRPRTTGHSAIGARGDVRWQPGRVDRARSEEHTSELQSLMRISYAVFCLKKKKTYHKHTSNIQT